MKIEYDKLLILKILSDHIKRKKEPIKKMEKNFETQKNEYKIKHILSSLKSTLSKFKTEFHASAPLKSNSSFSQIDNQVDITRMIFVANIMKELSAFVQNKLKIEKVKNELNEEFLTINQNLYIMTEEDLMDIINKIKEI